jgi:hypothetical protein
VHVPKHEPVAELHLYPAGHGVDAAATHDPAEHVCPIVLTPSAPHELPEHVPISHVPIVQPSDPHCGLAAQVSSAARGPSTEEHVPTLPVMLHALHEPVHAVSQQTPSAHVPVPQVVAACVPHASPWFSFRHVFAADISGGISHANPARQSLSAAHVSGQPPPVHFALFGHAVGVAPIGVVQPPEPLHVCVTRRSPEQAKPQLVPLGKLQAPFWHTFVTPQPVFAPMQVASAMPFAIIEHVPAGPVPLHDLHGPQDVAAPARLQQTPSMHLPLLHS